MEEECHVTFQPKASAHLGIILKCEENGLCREKAEGISREVKGEKKG